MDVDNDTIVAISTPPGEGVNWNYSLKGSDSLNICSQIFVPSTYLKIRGW